MKILFAFTRVKIDLVLIFLSLSQELSNDTKSTDRSVISFSFSVEMINECQYEKPTLSLPNEICSPTESTDSGIHVTLERNSSNHDDQRGLPDGWEHFQDEQGDYYWHKRTGTVTRTRPETIISSPSLTLSSSSAESSFELNSLLYKSDSDNSIRTVDDHRTQHRFSVRSLGWTNVDEKDLINGNGSRTLNRCIYELTRSIDDSICRWGDGKDLFMDIHPTEIVFIDPTELTIVHQQSIPAIRVWGVGRENLRDFAYVAKDKDRTSSIFKCHVFRCENTTGRIIANTLRDICRNLMIERGLLTTNVETSTSSPESVVQLSFPAPIEESKKHLSCDYLGCIYVSKPSGMDVLRPAIEQVSSTVPQDKWIPVNVNISPTSIIVQSNDDLKEQLVDVRLRYLSFLGVGQNVNYAGIIVHCADNSFQCHVFHCRTSSVELCKNIEAACKLRYQKCLDAHPTTTSRIVTSKSFGAQLQKLVESFWWGNK